MDETICIDTTHSLGDVTLVPHTLYDQWGIPDYSDRIRQHLLILYFTTRTTSIRTFRLVIVTDRRVEETKDGWREVLTRQKQHTITKEPPEIVITLLASGEFHYQILPLPSDSLSSSSPSSLRILHDKTYLLNPNTNRLDFFFECIGGYVMLSADEIAGDYLHSYISTLRISPICSSIQEPGRVYPSLPTNAIHQICKNLLSKLEADDIRGHARLLTSCVLVCKGWHKSGVYNLLWPILIEKSWILELGDNHFINLVHCIKQFPQIGEGFLRLPCLTGLGRYNNFEEFRSMYGVLAKAATNLRRLSLMTYQWELAGSHLSPSQRIEYLYISGLEERIKLFYMLRVINPWIHLNELCIETWELEPSAQAPETSPAYELHKLALGGSALGSHSRFGYNSLPLWIIQHLLSRPDSLQSLSLNGITGLSQTDFKTIFHLIKSTIITLSVDDCLLTDSDRDSLPSESGSDSNGQHDRERAFDTVVSEMRSLQKVTLNIKGAQGGLSSSLSILRRKENLSPTNSLSGEFKCSWTLSPNDTIQDLENALKLTGWKWVSLLVKWNRDDEFSVARRIARERGVSLSVFLV